jgi:hypothetical protein
MLFMQEFCLGANTTHLWILVCSPNNFDVFVFVFCVQFLLELNPNRAKSLEFGGCRKNNKNVPKAHKKGPWFGHKGAPFVAFAFISYLSPLSPFISLSLLVPYIYNNNDGN